MASRNHHARVTGWIAFAVLAVLVLPCPAQVAKRAVVAANDPNAFILNEQQFNSWAFGNANSSNNARESLDTQLTVYLNDIERSCQLPPYQREKLELAGRGDIERFFALVDQKRDQLQGKAFDQNKISDVYQELQPIQQRFNQGLFEGDSLLAKTAATILDTDQATRYEEVLRERRAFHYRAKVELFITKLGDSLGLTNEQRDTFIKVVLERTQSPRRIGHQYDQYIVMYKIASIPEEALRPVLGDARYRVLTQHLQQARGIKEFLVTNGYLDEDDAAQD